MQGKGGVGKTYIASLLAQFLMERGSPVFCIDTDAVNASLTDFRALKADPVDLFKPGSDEIDVNAMDAMAERLLTEDGDFVMDNGATSFVPLARYLIQDGIPDALEEAGRKLVIHAVIAGGQEQTQTGKGFDSLATQFPRSADLVLWLNEHHGAIRGGGGSDFETTPLYRKHRDRLRGVVRLPKLHPQTFGANLAAMLDLNLTFTEADTGTDENGKPYFFTIARQRLVQIKRQAFEQIERVV